MLRLLIGTGLLLMAVGFGAAGWQYWQTMPRQAAAATAPVTGAEAAAPDAAAQAQGWLISPTGGLVPAAKVRSYLQQDRFTPERVLQVKRQARLDDLLAEGEKLPEPAFLQVLADIRAPKVADGLCEVLLETLAADCAVNAARVVDGSVDASAGTAMFTVDLVYRLKPSNEDLPDLAAHVLQEDAVQVATDVAAVGTESPEAALRLLVEAATAACAGETARPACRPTRMMLEWADGQPVVASADIAWLAPLPQGMFVAPPLDGATGG